MSSCANRIAAGLFVVLACSNAPFVGGLIASGALPGDDGQVFRFAAFQEQEWKQGLDVVSEELIQLRRERGRPRQLAHQFEAVDEHRARWAVSDRIDPRTKLVFEKGLDASAIEVVDDARVFELARVRISGWEVQCPVLVDRKDPVGSRWNFPSEGSVLHLGCEIDDRLPRWPAGLPALR